MSERLHEKCMLTTWPQRGFRGMHGPPQSGNGGAQMKGRGCIGTILLDSETAVIPRFKHGVACMSKCVSILYTIPHHDEVALHDTYAFFMG